MLLKVGLFLLTVWLLGAVGVYDIGAIFHVLLLAGLMLVLLAVLKDRDVAAAQRNRRGPDQQ